MLGPGQRSSRTDQWQSRVRSDGRPVQLRYRPPDDRRSTIIRSLIRPSPSRPTQASGPPVVELGQDVLTVTGPSAWAQSLPSGATRISRSPSRHAAVAPARTVAARTTDTALALCLLRASKYTMILTDSSDVGSTSDSRPASSRIVSSSWLHEHAPPMRCVRKPYAVRGLPAVQSCRSRGTLPATRVVPLAHLQTRLPPHRPAARSASCRSAV